jgi:hypothetical protein
MPVTTRDLKTSRQLVENLLKVHGEKYNEWLQEKHQEFIEENQSLILQALNAFTSTTDIDEEQNDTEPDDEMDFLHEEEERQSLSTIRS